MNFETIHKTIKADIIIYKFMEKYSVFCYYITCLEANCTIHYILSILNLSYQLIDLLTGLVLITKILSVTRR